MLSEKFFSERNKKTITPPLQVKWSLLKNKLEEPVKKMTLHFVSLIPARQKVNLIKQLQVVICILYGGGSRISSLGGGAHIKKLRRAIPDTLLKVSLNTNKTGHHVIRYT